MVSLVGWPKTEVKPAQVLLQNIQRLRCYFLTCIGEEVGNHECQKLELFKAELQQQVRSCRSPAKLN